MPSKKLGKIWCLIRESWLEFVDVNPFQMGAALAYYAVFALPPVLIIMINSAGMFFGKQAVKGEIYAHIKDYIGPEGALEVQKMVENISQSEGLTFATVIGLVALLLAATGAFISLQDSLNFIWGVKPKVKKQYLKLLRDRLMSFLLIQSSTLLLLTTVILQSALTAISNYISAHSSVSDIYLAYIVNFIVSTLLITVLFGALYKFLPDAIISWKDVRVGAFVTALLFTIGKTIIGTYMAHSDIASVYGAAGVMAILLTWVFYSSQILFFGAVFTRVYSRMFGDEIYQSAYAVRVVYEEVEMGKRAVNKDPGKYAEPEDGEEAKPPVVPA